MPFKWPHERWEVFWHEGVGGVFQERRSEIKVCYLPLFWWGLQTPPSLTPGRSAQRIMSEQLRLEQIRVWLWWRLKEAGSRQSQQIPSAPAGQTASSCPDIIISSISQALTTCYRCRVSNRVGPALTELSVFPWQLITGPHACTVFDWWNSAGPDWTNWLGWDFTGVSWVDVRGPFVQSRKKVFIVELVFFIYISWPSIFNWAFPLRFRVYKSWKCYSVT